MLTTSLAAIAVLVADAAATIYYAGVAESSGEFGVWSPTATPGTGLPGRFGVDYQFINTAGIDTYVDQNNHFNFYKEAIDYITVTKGAYAILDPHNYMRYNDPSSQPSTGSIIGDTTDPKAATTAQFGEFWEELAGRFKHNKKVIFGINNEPHDMATSLVLENDQAAVNGIRKSGAKNLIIAPGNGYTGGHAWLQSSQGDDPSGDWMYKLTDPLNNTAFDIHEYLDVDFSGGHLNCSQAAATNLDGLTAWLKQYGFKAMITEFGAANGTQCKPYLQDLLTYMADHEEYIGWTAWAAGPLWGSSSPCCTSGGQYGSLEPGSLAADGSPGLYSTVWLPEIEPLVPKKLQWSGLTSVHGGPLTKKPHHRRGADSWP